MVLYACMGLHTLVSAHACGRTTHHHVLACWLAVFFPSWLLHATAGHTATDSKDTALGGGGLGQAG